MTTKTRIGILVESISSYRYRISLHPNFSTCYQEGKPVYFEVIDADGKLKQVFCSVEALKKNEDESQDQEEGGQPFRFLNCERVLNIVENHQCELIAPPPPGRVVYLASALPE